MSLGQCRAVFSHSLKYGANDEGIEDHEYARDEGRRAGRRGAKGPPQNK